MTTDAEFLRWIHERLISAYEEHPETDYMRRLWDIAEKLDDTPKVTCEYLSARVRKYISNRIRMASEIADENLPERVVIERDAPVMLSDFLEKHNLEVVVKEWTGHFTASIPYSDIKDGSMLSGIHGDGITAMRAVADYAQRISGRLLVIQIPGSERREIRVPQLKL
jgi:hypothetical protein